MKINSKHLSVASLCLSVSAIAFSFHAHYMAKNEHPAAILSLPVGDGQIYKEGDKFVAQTNGWILESYHKEDVVKMLNEQRHK